MITFGPYFIGTARSLSRVCPAVPLELSLEWAGDRVARSIPLFRHGLQNELTQLRLEDILFRASDLPIDLACPQVHVLETVAGTFLPLESLLAALYTKLTVARSIRVVLAELASVVPLINPARRPILTPGLLKPRLESEGYCLHTIIPGGAWCFVEIGWRPEGHPHVFHAGICRFLVGDKLLASHWQPPGRIGAAQLLYQDLERLAPGPPKNLLTPAGTDFVQNPAKQSAYD